MSQTLNPSTLDTDLVPSGWTLADFLSTYRFWAIFLAYFFVVFAGYSLNAAIPPILIENGLSSATIGIFYSSAQLAWIIGAFIAFAIAGRLARTALIVPLAICAIVALAAQWNPNLFSSLTFLVVFGLAKGVVLTVFTLATAILLVGGKPNKLDFAGAFVLMSMPFVLSSTISPVVAAMLINGDEAGSLVMWGFFACTVLAGLVLLPCKRLAFDDAPRIRHKPLQPRQRSPLKVGFLTVLVGIALIAIIYILLPHYLYPGRSISLSTLSSGTIFALALFGIVALCSIIYFAYWIYRIHGELAGDSASQRLLTPLAALLIALFVPMALLVLLITLGDLLNDRSRAKGSGSALSIVWLMIFCVLLPPVAMAMIQRAANKSLVSG